MGTRIRSQRYCKIFFTYCQVENTECALRLTYGWCNEAYEECWLGLPCLHSRVVSEAEGEEKDVQFVEAGDLNAFAHGWGLEGHVGPSRPGQPSE